jgi:hypothetical protein
MRVRVNSADESMDGPFVMMMAFSHSAGVVARREGIAFRTHRPPNARIIFAMCVLYLIFACIYIEANPVISSEGESCAIQRSFNTDL